MDAKICIDLDGVLAQYADDDVIGEPIDGAKEFLEELHKLGSVMIHTCRISLLNYEGGVTDYPAQRAYLHKRQQAIRRWLQNNDMHSSSIWFGVGKPKADVYIDDKAVKFDSADGGQRNRILSEIRGMLQ